MRVAGMLSGLLLVTACSDGTADAPAPAVNDTVEPSTASPAVSGTVSGGNPAGKSLTGKVSALAGNVSGLNTRLTDTGLAIDLSSDALFEYDKAELTPAAEIELRKAAELIRQSPAGLVQVVGHTDSEGSSAYNQALSEARAKTVADWFGRQVGVRQRQFAVLGKGETAPVTPNAKADGTDDPAGRAKNRRVEVIVPTSDQANDLDR